MAQPNAAQTNKTLTTTTRRLRDNEAEDDPLTLHTSYTCNTNQEQQYAFYEGYQL